MPMLPKAPVRCAYLDYTIQAIIAISLQHLQMKRLEKPISVILFLSFLLFAPIFGISQTPKSKGEKTQSQKETKTDSSLPTLEETKNWIVNTLDDNLNSFYDPENGTAKDYRFKFRGNKLIINFNLSLFTENSRHQCEVTVEIDLLKIGKIAVENSSKNSITFISDNEKGVYYVSSCKGKSSITGNDVNISIDEKYLKQTIGFKKENCTKAMEDKLNRALKNFKSKSKSQKDIF